MNDELHVIGEERMKNQITSAIKNYGRVKIVFVVSVAAIILMWPLGIYRLPNFKKSHHWPLWSDMRDFQFASICLFVVTFLNSVFSSYLGRKWNKRIADFNMFVGWASSVGVLFGLTFGTYAGTSSIAVLNFYLYLFLLLIFACVALLGCLHLLILLPICIISMTRRPT